MDDRESRQDSNPCAGYRAAVRRHRTEHFPRALARQPLAVLTAGIILTFGSNAISSAEIPSAEIPSAENCQRRKVLANQYSGVELTGAHKQLKRKMVAFYSRRCIRGAHR